MVKNNALVYELIRIYNVWRDARIFTHKPYNTIDFEKFLNLPCFNFTSVEEINNEI